MNDVKLVKIVKGDIVYYVQDNLPLFLAKPGCSHLNLMMHANYAICRQTNKVLKCRFLIEEVFDALVL